MAATAVKILPNALVIVSCGEQVGQGKVHSSLFPSTLTAHCLTNYTLFAVRCDSLRLYTGVQQTVQEFSRDL